jgi:hypothetical protein
VMLQVTMCEGARRSFAEIVVDVAIEQGELPEGARGEAVEAIMGQIGADTEVEIEAQCDK